MNEEAIREMIAEAMSASTRDKAKASDYGDPDAKKFPIMTQASVLAASRLIGRAKGYSADKKASVIARIKRIAKRKGFYLPKSWQGKEAVFVLSDQMKADAVQAALMDEDDPDMDGDDDSGRTSWDDYERPIVRHVFPDNTVVFQMGWDGDWFKRGFTIDDNGEATLGADCTQVQPQLTFAEFTDDDEVTERRESQMRHSGTMFREMYEASSITASDDGGFTISGTAINPGINKSGNRIYSVETLAKALPLFQGKKMYIDHPDMADEREGVRSFRDAAAKITEAWKNDLGGIDYKAVVYDPPTLEKLTLMKKVGALDAVGTSVNYYGTSSKVQYEGRTVDNIEAIDELNSLDFVTEPGAWGDIARVESKAARVAQPERKVFVMDEETKKLFERMEAALKEQTTATEAARNEAAEARKEAKAARVSAQIEKMLTDSKLPEETVERLRVHFEGVDTIEGVADTIKAEADYIVALHKRFEAAAKTKSGDPPRRRTNIVVGMGNTGKGVGTTEAEETEDDEHEPTKEEFAEAFADFMPGGKTGAAQFFEAMS
jgi:hypothetical protein